MLGQLFQCDPDIRLAGSEIYLDPHEPRRTGIVSHGHSDHIGRHQHFIATPATAAFLRHRSGADLRGTELAWGEVHEVDGWSIELFPAGHVLGSAMVKVTGAAGSLAYTGDFRLASSCTAEAAVIPVAGTLIMESTYGSPEWRFPPRDVLRERLRELVVSITRRGRTAVLLAYSLGKAQETMALLRDSGVPLVVHPTVAQIAAIYQRNGIDLGTYEVWGSQSSLFGHRSTLDLYGKAVIVPPHFEREIRRIPRAETIALTGWALRGVRDADHGLPLSDHADFEELIELAEQSQAEVIYVTHGSKRFAEELRRRGMRAEFLRGRPQMRLF